MIDSLLKPTQSTTRVKGANCVHVQYAPHDVHHGDDAAVLQNESAWDRRCGRQEIVHGEESPPVRWAEAADGATDPVRKAKAFQARPWASNVYLHPEHVREAISGWKRPVGDSRFLWDGPTFQNVPLDHFCRDSEEVGEGGR